jgi:hypothetical protein
VTDSTGPNLSEGWRVPARSRFEVSLEARKVSRLKSIGSLAADVALSVGVGSPEAPLDSGRDRYRVLVTDRETGAVVRRIDCKGDAQGAKESLNQMESDLDRLTIAEFIDEYGIEA